MVINMLGSINDNEDLLGLGIVIVTVVLVVGLLVQGLCCEKAEVFGDVICDDVLGGLVCIRHPKVAMMAIRFTKDFEAARELDHLPLGHLHEHGFGRTLGLHVFHGAGHLTSLRSIIVIMRLLVILFLIASSSRRPGSTKEALMVSFGPFLKNTAIAAYSLFKHSM